MYIKKILWAVAIIGLLIFGGIAYYIYGAMFQPNTKFQNETAYVFIPTNANYIQVRQQLEPLLDNIDSFDAVAEQKKYISNIKAGRFAISKGMNNNEIINSIRSKNLPVKVAFNNQHNLEDLAGRISIQIEADEDLPFLAFGDSDSAKMGEWVLAVGNPFNLNSTVTAGIISAKSRDLSGRNTQSFIQTDAAVNPGNSGGALVNTNGDLIGINTAISSRDGSYIGYSFAVPSNIARKIVNDIMEYGNVQNGILGVVGSALNSQTAEQIGTDMTEGFYVSDVTEDTGAEKAGIKSGDIIKKIDNVEINKFKKRVTHET